MGEEAVREIRCRCTELRCKDVISAADGTRLGYVTDVEIDTCSASVQAIYCRSNDRRLLKNGHSGHHTASTPGLDGAYSK